LSLCSRSLAAMQHQIVQIASGLSKSRPISCLGDLSSLYDELEAAPADLKGLLKNVEYIPCRNKGYEQGPMMGEIMRRGNLTLPEGAGGEGLRLRGDGEQDVL